MKIYLFLLLSISSFRNQKVSGNEFSNRRIPFSSSNLFIASAVCSVGWQSIPTYVALLGLIFVCILFTSPLPKCGFLIRYRMKLNAYVKQHLPDLIGGATLYPSVFTQKRRVGGSLLKSYLCKQSRTR
jgi:hypothetical protein